MIWYAIAIWLCLAFVALWVAVPGPMTMFMSWGNPILIFSGAFVFLLFLNWMRGGGKNRASQP